jgi:circadian clock protein KaiC
MRILLDAAAASGQLVVEWRPPLEVLLDEVVENLLGLVEHHRPTRLVLDGLSGLRDAVVNAERDQPFTAALLHEIKARGATTLITEELPLFFEGTGVVSRSAAFVENIVYLRYVEEPGKVARALSLVKVRDGDHDPSIRAFSLSSAGIAIADAAPDTHSPG